MGPESACTKQTWLTDLNDMKKQTLTYKPNDGKDANRTYIPGKELIEAVNLAIYLDKPLLLQGEPGCGKTKLAEDVAYSLYHEKYGDDYKKFYREWFVKSTSKAKDGLYTFDHLNRLRDVHANDLKTLDKYVSFGSLGEAILQEEERCVILIDEVDKADIDFPNDLLLELDEQRFVITEMPEKNKLREVVAKNKPIVIITSNNEKPLPPAFLRRCLYFFIEFPNQTQLTHILQSHFKGANLEALSKTTERFEAVRNLLYQPGDKNLSTGELIDWFKALDQDFKAYEKELGEENQLPFSSILLKSKEMIDKFKRLSQSQSQRNIS